MIARNLIETARSLIPSGPGRPRQTDLRRAASTIYCAAFHRLMQCCADRLVGAGPARQTPAWNRVYRALNHGQCAKVYRSRETKALSLEIRELTTLLTDLRGRRHAADYDPAARFTKSEIQTVIKAAEDALDAFDSSSANDQRELAVLLLFRDRPD